MKIIDLKKTTIILGYEKTKGAKIPIILCSKRTDIPFGMKFYCQYCKKNHLHGEKEGHRVAHCYFNSKSPFEKTGYIITLNKYYRNPNKRGENAE